MNVGACFDLLFPYRTTINYSTKKAEHGPVDFVQGAIPM